MAGAFAWLSPTCQRIRYPKRERVTLPSAVGDDLGNGAPHSGSLHLADTEDVIRAAMSAATAWSLWSITASGQKEWEVKLRKLR